MKKKSFNQVMSDIKKVHDVQQAKSAFINLRPLLGNFNWAEFLWLIGGAQAGKSYAIIDFFCHQFVEHGTPFYWIRLTQRQSRQLLENNAEKLIDPDIRRRYGFDIVTRGENVYVVEREEKEIHKKDGSVEIKTVITKKTLLARVMDLSTYYADKGNGYFDKDYKGWYNIGLDEFQPEKNEKRTFDVVYAFVRQMENLVRNTKSKVRIIGACNLLEEASDILCCFDFIPEQFGVYKLKKKRAVIAYIEPTEAYKEMRKGSIADILLPNASMYSNVQNTDNTLVYKGRLEHPSYIIKFTKDQNTWFTVWDSNVVRKYNRETKPVRAMRPYLDELYSPEIVKTIISLFDTRCYRFANLITFKQFQSQLELLKPRG